MAHTGLDANRTRLKKFLASDPGTLQVALIYMGTKGCCRIAFENVKRFEEHFLLEMENKLPEVMAEFLKVNSPEDGLKKTVEGAI